MVNILSKRVKVKHHKCCVPKCPESAGHRFPKNEALKRKWMIIIQKIRYQPNWIPNDGSRICKKHFKDSDFLKTSKLGSPLRHYRLKPGTIPTKFPWSQPEAEHSSSKKNESKSIFSLSPNKDVANSKVRSKLVTYARSSPFSTKMSISEGSKKGNAETFFAKDRSKISKAKSKSEVSSTNEKTLKRGGNPDVSNWEYRLIKKESLHLEEILGKIEYVFSLQDLNGRELEAKELEEIISSFPPLQPPNQIFPLRSSN